MIEAIKAIQMVYANTTKHDWSDDIWDAICKAIETDKQSDSVEPVAWIEHHKGGDNLVWDEPNKGTPLYTHPQPKREPLTDEQIKQFLDDCDEGQEDAEYILAFARAIEAAHGIKENT